MNDPELKVNVFVAAITHCALYVATLKLILPVCPVLSRDWVPEVPIKLILV
jgi:hypothetical protein